MLDVSGMLIMVVILALAFDFSNGWHDSANSIATCVTTRVLSPLTAVLMAAVLEVAGAFFSTAVAKTIGKGIVDPSMVTELVVVAALGGAILWNTTTLILGLPSSSSHALIGGLVGAGVVHAGWGVVKISGLFKVLEAMLLSPLFGFLVGLFLMVVIFWVTFGTLRVIANWLFRRMQVVSAGFMAFSHGANDAQKAMGIITLALLSSGHQQTDEIQTWVIVSCALAMGFGVAMGGWRIIRTIGQKLVRLEPVHGFAAETGAGIVLMTTAQIGLPVSTTHTITSSIMGVGAIKGLSAVKWGVTKRILFAWVCTIPGAALFAVLLYFGLTSLGLN